MLVFERHPMVLDQARGAQEISDVVGCTTRHIYHLVEKCHFPYERVGSTLCLRRSVYHAWLWAQAQLHANWNAEEAALVEMNLSVRKAAALIEQIRQRQLSVHSLDPEQLTCFAAVMESAVLAADKALTAKAG
jgi:excisionase family DNA binding protein